MLICINCGKESRVRFGDKNLCLKCYNKFMSKQMDIDLPRTVPEVLFFEDCKKVMHSFKIEFMVFPMGLSLKAIEVEPDEYECSIFGEIEEKFPTMWNKLLERLSKMLSRKYYVNANWVNDLAVGRLEYNENSDFSDVVIDGKRVSWEDLGVFLGRYQGFQIKIEIADATESLF
jgi:hypothetical protein